MAIHAIAQVAQHALTQSVRDERLVDAEGATRDGDRDHHHAQDDEQPDVGATAVSGEQRVVEDDLNQQRVDDTED